ncbi:transcriptional repressor CTCF [Patella vulgata]|uniref:transcriptional repressor CTCF n=1 Tax=Patella vulgata TaxID=6465 RepID=UPI0021803C87|nr:transcriptional repressor CTCF [Patella vulgata]XP_050396821.1 transcriptional repressor CTCF [Patella vulgata]XP_050396822.1 transcriptional repressor CTCF [Patella vulgata]
MDGSGDGTTPQPPQNLNELQSLLVSFNKEIEDQPVLPTANIVNADDPVFLESAEGDDSTPGTVEVSTEQPFSGFYAEQHGILETPLQEDNDNSIPSIVASSSNDIQNSSITPESLASVQMSAGTSHLTEDLLQPGQEMSLQGIQPHDLAALSQSSGNVLRIVSIGNDGQMHIVSEEQLQQGSEITSLQTGHLTGQMSDENAEAQQSIIDGTDPVAVLASVAANTSSVSHLQTVTMNQGDLHNPQLVALQNSADSSQPQLVAVQNADGTSTEAVQIIGGADGSALSQALFQGANNSFQTVTLVPSETGPGGEVSYVLIMSPPEGENADGTGMSVYDFKEEGREITEEIIEEDGKTRRILRITPKNAFIGNGQLMCTYCNYTSPKRYLLTRHMKTHSEERPHKCHICERGFKTLASLTNHVNTHTGVRPHKCKMCESAFTTSGELVRHVRYKHTFEKPHKCNVCEYASVELSKLKRHMRSHTGERPYQCPHCTYASPDTYKLKRHLRIHTGEKPYECLICHARFTQSNSLKAHKLIHTGTKPVFQCEYCPTTCGRRTDLKIHVQKLHMSEHPLLCRKCGQNFPDRYTYKIHIKTHEGEKCFKCESCGHAALSQRHLESHQLIHTGEKPFECKSCEHAFRQKQLLKRHENLHHTPNYEPPSPKDKAHECQDCEKAFAHKGNLARHLTNHNEDGTVNDEEDEEATGAEGEEVESINSLIAQNILEKNLMQEWRDGKLGNAQQVVIVHPDGTVEEVTHKLQGPQTSQHSCPHGAGIPPCTHTPTTIPSCTHTSTTTVSLPMVSDTPSIPATTSTSEESELLEVKGDISEEVKPDVSQIMIKEEPGIEVTAPHIVISALIDETKEAGTQAELESEGEDSNDIDKHKNVNTGTDTDSNTLNIERVDVGEHIDATSPDLEDSESNDEQPAMFYSPIPIPLADIIKPSNVETDDIPIEPQETEEMKADVYVTEQNKLDVTELAEESKTSTQKSYTVVKLVSSPDRQTRSMKRKESTESQSPAKRTRRATAEKS